MHGAYGVTVNTGACGALDQGSIPCRHPKTTSVASMFWECTRDGYTPQKIMNSANIFLECVRIDTPQSSKESL